MIANGDAALNAALVVKSCLSVRFSAYRWLRLAVLVTQNGTTRGSLLLTGL